METSDPGDVVAERRRGRPAIFAASAWDTTIFAPGGGASALTMHRGIAARLATTQKTKIDWRRDRQHFFRTLLGHRWRCSRSPI